MDNKSLYLIFTEHTYQKDLDALNNFYSLKKDSNNYNNVVFRAIIKCIEILFKYLKKDINEKNIREGLINNCNCKFNILTENYEAIYNNACEFVNYYLKDLVSDICNDTIILMDEETNENIKLIYSLIKKYPECLKIEYTYNCIQSGKPYDPEICDYIQIKRDTNNILNELRSDSKLLTKPLMINYKDLEVEDLEFLKKCKYLDDALDNIELRLEEIFGRNIIYSHTKLPIYIA